MDKEIAGMDVAVGAVGSESERRSSTLSTAQDDGAVAALAPGQRWSLSRKRDAVLRLMQGDDIAPPAGGSRTAERDVVAPDGARSAGAPGPTRSAAVVRRSTLRRAWEGSLEPRSVVTKHGGFAMTNRAARIRFIPDHE
jgi:hypothetical protein